MPSSANHQPHIPLFHPYSPCSLLRLPIYLSMSSTPPPPASYASSSSQLSQPVEITKTDRKTGSWTSNDDAVFLRILQKAKEKGRMSDNGFRLEVWKEAVVELEKVRTVGGEKTVRVCKSRWERASICLFKLVGTACLVELTRPAQ
jgi:hypothetical protein